MSEHSLTKPAPAKVAVTTGAEVRGIVPTDLDQVWRIAQAYQASGLAPKGRTERPERKPRCPMRAAAPEKTIAIPDVAQLAVC
jgi:hypothetical protein